MNNISPLLALSGLSIALIVIIVILLIAVIALYFIGKKSRKEAGRAAENYAGELTVN